MTTLVLLHGAPGDGSLWQPVIAALPAHVTVVSPTLRFFDADPGKAGAAFGTEVHTDQTIQLLEQLAPAPVAVAAWSYSSHVVLDTLLRRPGLVDRAFLYEPGLATYLSDPEEIDAYARDARDAFGPIAVALAEHGPERAVEVLFDSSGGAGSFASLSPERRDRYLASAHVMPLLMGGGKPPAELTAARLGGIAKPLEVAVGARTRPLFAIASRAVARAVPNARLEVIANADHMLPETDPTSFAAVLRQWLDRTA